MTMVKNKLTKKQGDTTKKTTKTKQQVTGNTNMNGVNKNFEEMLVKYSWYRFTELRDQKWIEFKQDKMPTHEPCLKTILCEVPKSGNMGWGGVKGHFKGWKIWEINNGSNKKVESG